MEYGLWDVIKDGRRKLLLSAFKCFLINKQNTKLGNFLISLTTQKAPKQPFHTVYVTHDASSNHYRRR